MNKTGNKKSTTGVLLTILILIAISTGYSNESNSRIYKYFWNKCMLLPVFAPPEHDEMIFADFLYEKELYDDAITEYRRELFSNLDGIQADYARFMISMCNIHLGNDDRIRSSLNEIAYNATDESTGMKARLLSSLHYMSMGEPERAHYELADMIRTSDKSYHGEINYFIGWLHLLEGDIESGNEHFSNVISDSLSSMYYQRRAYEISRYFSTFGIQLEQKSPEFAKFLSSVLPGSGQMYSGQYFNGFSSMAINTGLGYSTLSYISSNNYFQAGYIFILLWQRYYFGGRDTAELMAEEYNQSYRDIMLKKLIDIFIVES